MDIEDDLSENSIDFGEYSDYEEPEKKEVYESYEFYSLDNVFLGFAGKGQVKWMSKKRNECIVDHVNKKIILDKLYDPAKKKATRHIDKKNNCVCCGDEYELSITRIIPQYITTLFPPECKTGSENVISICQKCIKKKDKFQKSYLDAIYTKYDVDTKKLAKYDFLQDSYKRAKRYLNSFTEDSAYIRRNVFERKIGRKLNEYYFQTKKLVTKEDIENFVRDVEENHIFDPNKDYIHEELLSKIDDASIFKELWMVDFFEYMQVSHMPQIIAIN
jgi:hypothetical protein